MAIAALLDVTWFRWRAGRMKARLAKAQAYLADLQSQEDEIFLRLLGLMTRDWAQVETAMDLCNFYAINTPEGREIAKELPRSLNPKIDVFKKSHRRVPSLSDLCDQGIALASRVTEMKDQRHDFIHGTVTTLPGPASRPRRVQRIIYEGPFFDLAEYDFSMEEFSRLVSEIGRLSGDLLDHQVLIVARLAPCDSHDAGG